MSIREYQTKVESLCDRLAAAGHTITDIEYVLSILSWLDDEYESLVAVISSRDTTPSLQYVHSILLAHEGRIEQK